MYSAHFGLTEAPFSLTPNPRYLYMSERHREGLAHLLYGIRRPGGFVQLTGEVGTGKTTLCRCLLEQLPPEVDVTLILNPRLTVVEFLATLCDELHVAYPAESTSVKMLVDALQSYLLDAHARGRRTVLIIDEAQNLSADVLEQIRLLTNLETAAEKLLQIILIGQPELVPLLQGRHLRQLAQRITARYHLLPFAARDTRAYIRHRLQVAGGHSEIFTRAAIRCVRRLSGGVPRLINVICDRALLGAYAHDRRRVNAAMVRQAGREVRGQTVYQRRGIPLAWSVGLAAFTAAVAALVVVGSPREVSLPWSDRAASAVSASKDTPAVAHVIDEGPQTQDAALPSSSGTDGNPGAVIVAHTPSPPSQLADLLDATSALGDDHEAFASLCALWGLEYRKAESGLGCDALRSMGLECAFRSGNWSRLRRLDLPAILELVGPKGERRRVALVALGKERATVAIGGREHTLPLGEIDQLWEGSFILVWKAPPVRSHLISRGMRGKDVEWLRTRLDAVEGRLSPDRSSNVYDAALQERVAAFQRSRSLTPDGVVGEETLAHLTVAARDAGTPSLSSQAP